MDESAKTLSSESIQEIITDKNLAYQESIFPFPVFGESNTVIYKYRKELFHGRSNLSDAHTWTRRKKNFPQIKPRYTEHLINQQPVQSIACTEVNNPSLTKCVIVTEGEIFVLYKYDGDVSIYKPPTGKQERVQEKDRIAIRDALKGRSVRAAKEVLAKSGKHYTDQQVRNQVKYVENVQKIKKGCVPVTEPCQLANVASLWRNAEFIQSNIDGVNNYQYIQLFEKNIALFAKSCPSKDEYTQYQDRVSKIRQMTKNVARENMKQLTSEYKGYRFASGLFVDTTFCLTDSLVTIVAGQVSRFKTQSSKKNRILILGVMLSQSKNSNVHEKFAEKLSHHFTENYPDRTVPFVMSDGEKALQLYAEKFETHHLLCHVHLLDNYKRCLNNKNLFDKTRVLVFGSMDEDLGMSKCLLSSITKVDFENKFNFLSEKLETGPRRWLKNRKNDLYEKASWKARLITGFFQHFPSNNHLESLNSLIKLRIPHQVQADKCILVLQKMAEEMYQECYRAALGTDSKVLCTESCDLVKLTDEERQEMLRDLGFNGCKILAWHIPFSLTNILDVEELEQRLQESEGFQFSTFKKDYLIEIPDGSLVHVRAEPFKRKCSETTAKTQKKEQCHNRMRSVADVSLGSLKTDTSILSATPDDISVSQNTTCRVFLSDSDESSEDEEGSGCDKEKETEISDEEEEEKGSEDEEKEENDKEKEKENKENFSDNEKDASAPQNVSSNDSLNSSLQKYGNQFFKELNATKEKETSNDNDKPENNENERTSSDDDEYNNYLERRFKQVNKARAGKKGKLDEPSDAVPKKRERRAKRSYSPEM